MTLFVKSLGFEVFRKGATTLSINSSFLAVG